MKILLIDNYDSFTYNLYHYVSKFKKNVDVIRNDKIDGKTILRKRYNSILCYKRTAGMYAECKHLALFVNV